MEIGIVLGFVLVYMLENIFYFIYIIYNTAKGSICAFLK